MATRPSCERMLLPFPQSAKTSLLVLDHIYRYSPCTDQPVIIKIVERFPRPSPLPLGSGGTLGHKNQDDFDDTLAELELDIQLP